MKPRLGKSLVPLVLLLAAVSTGALNTPINASTPPQICVGAVSNPVLNDSGSYFANYPTGRWFAYTNFYDTPSVLKQGGTFHMWFQGAVRNVSGIFHATSSDGVSWNVGQSPALPQGQNGSWDFSGPYGPSVIWNGKEYMMYFWGDNGTGAFYYKSRSIGVATSLDGIHWNEYRKDPIVTPGPATFDSGYVKDPDVLYHNGVYEMWYKGRSPTINGSFFVGISRATSTDGFNWTKDLRGYVLGYANQSSFLQDRIYQKPSVVAANGTYVMAADDTAEIGYATSNDGIHWSSGNGWLVRPTDDYGWAGYATRSPSLLFDGSQLLMWYFGTSPQTATYDPFKSGIGLAECPNVLDQSSITKNMVTTNSESSTAIRSPPAATSFLSIYLAAGLASAIVVVIGVIVLRRKAA